MNLVFKCIASVIIFILTFSSYDGYISLADEQINLWFDYTPNIDIVLSKGRTNVNLTNFKNDMLNALTDYGIDKSRVNVSAIEAEEVNVQSAFTWKTDVSSTIGSISIVNNGQNVTMKGNPVYPGKNAIWIVPDQYKEQEFTFGYNIDYGDSFNAAGMLLRVQQSGNTLKGYMLSFNNSSWVSAAGSNNGAIWEFTYVIGQNSTNMTKVLKKGLSINKSGTLNVKVTDYDITVSGGGLSSAVNYAFSEKFGNGFGFFSDHYSHNCSSIGAFTLTNINLKTSTVKKFEELLRGAEWRENSLKVLVNVDDKKNDELDKAEAQQELITRLINDNVSLAAWGTSQNEAQFRNLLSINDEKGIFENNTDYKKSINETAQYIKSLIESKKLTNYILLEDNVDVYVTPDDIGKNTISEDYPYGKWKVIHEYDYFENNLGQYAKSGKYTSDLISGFDKVGKYTIYYREANVNPKVIYVHRRPVAAFNISRAGSTIDLISNSYDLDEYSNNSGIKEEKWYYKKSTDAEWVEEKLTTIEEGVEYLIKLQVQDHQGEWSESISKYVSSKTESKPVASFNIKNLNTSLYDQLEVIDSSYDPAGRSISSYTWKVEKNGKTIYTGSTPLLDYKSYGLGQYKMSLTVKNSANTSSETFSRLFNIVPDTEAPEFLADIHESGWEGEVTVNLQFSDRGGSQFKYYKYAITDSLDTPTAWSNQIAESNTNITVNQIGIKYLHVIASDNAGNISEDRVLGPYMIDGYEPSGEIVSSNTNWTNQSFNLTITATDNESGMQKIKLPDGRFVEGDTATYEVSENGTYTFVMYDRVGNSAEQGYTVSNVDKEGPDTTLDMKIKEYALSDSIVWSSTDSKVGFAQIVLPNGSVTTAPTGEYNVEENETYTFIAYDELGNEQSESITVTNIDRVYPDLDLSIENEDFTLDTNIIWESADEKSGFKEITLPDGEISVEANGKFLIDENGVYSFTTYDNLGNNQSKEITVTNIDRVPPTTTLDIENKDFALDNNITWSSTDSQSGFGYIVLPNGEISRDAEGKFFIEENGIYKFVAYDNLGNHEEVEIEVTIIDRVAPDTTLDIKYREFVLSSVITWESSDSQSGFKEIILPNNERSTEASGEFKIIANGTYVFEAIDNLGNSKIEEIVVTNIDREGPNTNLNIVNTTYDLNNLIAWKSDDRQSGFSHIVVPTGAVTREAMGRFTAKANGIFTFVAYDNLGNSRNESIEVTDVDTEAPTIEIVGNYMEYTKEDIVLTIKVNDKMSGVAWLELPDGTQTQEKKTTYRIKENGVYEFKAYDNLLNHITKKITIDKIDREKPTIEIEEVDLNIGTGKVIAWKVNDEGAGYKELKLPDGTITKANTGKIYVESNEELVFTAYDDLGNFSVEKYTVTGLEE